MEALAGELCVSSSNCTSHVCRIFRRVLVSAGRYVFLDHVLNYTNAEMADMRQLAALSAAANAKATPFIPGTVQYRTEQSAAFARFFRVNNLNAEILTLVF
jgi:hypothetical protein